MSAATPERIAEVAKINAGAYKAEIPAEAEPGRRLVISYGGVAPDEAEAHIRKIREKAWAVFPYGGVGAFWFLRLAPLHEEPLFNDVISRLKSGSQSFLEVGCCLGVVLRYLIAQGVPSQRIYGTDLHPGFLDLGHELFRDKDTKATYVAGDMLNEADTRLACLQGKMDVIYAASFFHLFERDEQVTVAKRMVGFLKDSPDVLIFGWNEGKKLPGCEKYIVDADTWKGIWEEVGEATGIRWTTQMSVDVSDGWIKVRFSVRRTS